MQGIILVGGEGTRLRPLTSATPKAMVPILGRPFLEHMLVYLRGYGIDQITLALGHNPRPIVDYFGDGSRWGVRLKLVVEPEPLGSGGAIKQFQSTLTEPFFAFNGDILTNMNIAAMRRAHERTRAAVSIFLIEVDDPSAFGIAALDGEQRISAFIEKPALERAPSRWANAGVWLFQPHVPGRIASGRRSMVEQELFPELIAAGERVQGYIERCFWVDIGTPARYLAAQLRLLEAPELRILPLTTWPGSSYLRARGDRDEPPLVAADAIVRGPVLLGPDVQIGSGAVVQGPAAIGAGSRLGAGCELTRSVLWDGVILEAGSSVTESVLANGVHAGSRAVLSGVVVGAGASFPVASKAMNLHVNADTIWTGGN